MLYVLSLSTPPPHTSTNEHYQSHVTCQDVGVPLFEQVVIQRRDVLLADGEKREGQDLIFKYKWVKLLCSMWWELNQSATIVSLCFESSEVVLLNTLLLSRKLIRIKTAINNVITVIKYLSLINNRISCKMLLPLQCLVKFQWNRPRSIAGSVSVYRTDRHSHITCLITTLITHARYYVRTHFTRDSWIPSPRPSVYLPTRKTSAPL